MKQASAIPQPKTYGPLKNLPHLEKEQLSQSLWRIADELGTIFRFDFPGVSSVFVSATILWLKCVMKAALTRTLAKACKRCANSGEMAYLQAGRTNRTGKKPTAFFALSFSQKAMKGYHSMMLDIATQLIQKWSRLNPNEEIDVADDMTRLTLDTIGLCGFNYRFNSFYRDSQHPFITSMLRALKEAMNQSKRLVCKIR
nr:cytochrome P450 [Bacillus subtilis]